MRGVSPRAAYFYCLKTANGHEPGECRGLLRTVNGGRRIDRWDGGLTERYYTEISQIRFYKLHPSYIPFVGSDYDTYRILHIGESHYCGAMDAERFGIDYFSRWFDEPCAEVECGLLQNNITRRVAKGVVDEGDRFSVFDNILRSFLKVVAEEESPHISKCNRCRYNYFAFMNYYPFPAFREKGSFLDSIRDYSKTRGSRAAADKLIEACESAATDTVDAVIEILKPRCIVFSSCDAGSAYKQHNGKYKDDPRMIYTSHPARPFTWNKPLSGLGYRKGIDVFEDGLKRIYRK